MSMYNVTSLHIEGLIKHNNKHNVTRQNVFTALLNKVDFE